MTLISGWQPQHQPLFLPTLPGVFTTTIPIPTVGFTDHAQLQGDMIVRTHRDETGRGPYGKAAHGRESAHLLELVCVVLSAVLV